MRVVGERPEVVLGFEVAVVGCDRDSFKGVVLVGGPAEALLDLLQVGSGW